VDLQPTCQKKDYGKIKVKVVYMFHQAKEQQVLISNLEKELKELQEFLTAWAKSDVHNSHSVEDDEHLQRSYVDDKDVSEEQDGRKEKSNNFTQVKHKAKKRVKSTVMKTPWTSYARAKK